MKYSIFCLLKGKAKIYHQKLVKEYAKKFNELYLIQFPLPSHITLKYPFEASESMIKHLEEKLKEFCKTHKKSSILLSKISNFDKKVVIIKATFSKEAIKDYKELMQTLEKSGIKLKKFDKEKKFHATIVYGNSKESFEKIWKSASKLKPNLKIYLDNITLMKKSGKFWKVYKTFRMN